MEWKRVHPLELTGVFDVLPFLCRIHAIIKYYGEERLV